MRTLPFLINITFSEKITSDDDIKEIAENIKNAIVHEINNGNGIAPFNSVAHTTEIEISQSGLILTNIVI